MTCTATETLLGIVRDELRALKAKNCELTEQLGQLRRDHDEHIREIAAERRKREHRGFVRLGVLTGILAVLDLVSLMIPIK